MKLFSILFLLICLNFPFAFGFDKPKDDFIQEFKNMVNFHKKPKIQPIKPKMVETKEEWEQEAVNIPLENRELKIEEPEIDAKKFHKPNLKHVFERYNYPSGKRELNYEDVKTKLYYYSYLVVDNNCQYAAYSHYFYSPENNQITSNFYVEKLDTLKTKTKRILEYNHKQEERIPIIAAGAKDYYPNLFNGLTLVDWSKDSKKLLIKERVGSTQGGIYKTYLYVHFLEDEINNGYTIKLTDFDETIKYYFLDWENKQITKYRYDIEPLGFSATNDDVIIALCYVYNKEGKKIFLGTWGYDCKKNQTMLLSKTNFSPEMSVNGLFLKQVLD